MIAPETVQLIMNYGFPATFAILFWKYIKDVQMRQIEQMNEMGASITRVEDLLLTNELERSKER